jgi:hypothetical protein
MLLTRLITAGIVSDLLIPADLTLLQSRAARNFSKLKGDDREPIHLPYLYSVLHCDGSSTVLPPCGRAILIVLAVKLQSSGWQLALEQRSASAFISYIVATLH